MVRMSLRHISQISSYSNISDCFLSKISENASDKQIWSVGLALDEQVIDEMVPRESHDRYK